MKSASTASPVISAISLKVSPAFSCPSELPRAAIAEDRGSHRAAQHDTEVRGFLAAVGNRFIGFERNDARAIDQLLQAFGGEVLEQKDLLFEKGGSVHGLGRDAGWQDGPIAPGPAIALKSYWWQGTGAAR